MSFEECLFASGESSAISFHLNRSGVSCHDMMFNNCQILEGSSAITLYANHGNNVSHIAFNNIRIVTVDDVNQRLSSHNGHLMMSHSRSGSHDALVLLSEDPGGIQDIDFHDGSYRFWGETSGDDAYPLPSLSRLLDFNGGNANLIAPVLVGVNASNIRFYPKTVHIVTDLGERHPIVFFGGNNFDIHDELSYDHVLQYVVGGQYPPPA